MVDTHADCLTHHLKMVVVAGRVMKKQVIQFPEYLLGHAMVLEMKVETEKQTLTSGPIYLFSNAPEYEERLMNAPLASASVAV
ncbi:hypothetical protein T459_20123 [Capsicum annuum]|uniref:Uncharacterized protein n=1 Tax=Capsicum annuum TaxID=4072 RepID=A0A2G2Z3W7_CAPAN|nr:hypothetical protein T459_20123 [Capsicum annuum]